MYKPGNMCVCYDGSRGSPAKAFITITEPPCTAYTRHASERHPAKKVLANLPLLIRNCKTPKILAWQMRWKVEVQQVQYTEANHVGASER
eukprot:4149684-Amphidinium_carterae.1